MGALLLGLSIGVFSGLLSLLLGLGIHLAFAIYVVASSSATLGISFYCWLREGRARHVPLTPVRPGRGAYPSTRGTSTARKKHAVREFSFASGD